MIKIGKGMHIIINLGRPFRQETFLNMPVFILLNNGIQEFSKTGTIRLYLLFVCRIVFVFIRVCY